MPEHFVAIYTDGVTQDLLQVLEEGRIQIDSEVDLGGRGGPNTTYPLIMAKDWPRARTALLRAKYTEVDLTEEINVYLSGQMSVQVATATAPPLW